MMTSDLSYLDFGVDHIAKLGLVRIMNEFPELPEFDWKGWKLALVRGKRFDLANQLKDIEKAWYERFERHIESVRRPV